MPPAIALAYADAGAAVVSGARSRGESDDTVSMILATQADVGPTARSFSRMRRAG